MQTESIKMSLFSFGHFELHSGELSRFKIDCDYLTDDDLLACAKIIQAHLYFNKVYGISTGGLKLAKKLEEYVATSVSGHLLIVDDVFTSGQSMEFARARKVNEGHDFNLILGAVIFARNPTPDWIFPVFSLSKQVCGNF